MKYYLFTAWLISASALAGGSMSRGGLALQGGTIGGVGPSHSLISRDSSCLTSMGGSTGGFPGLAFVGGSMGGGSGSGYFDDQGVSGNGASISGGISGGGPPSSFGTLQTLKNIVDSQAGQLNCD